MGNNDMVKPGPEYPYRNISIVSIVPAKCGAFKYQEMVLSDMNKTNDSFVKYLKSKNLKTTSIAPYSSKKIDNVYTIWRDEESPDLIKNSTKTKQCELFGLLLDSNTTLFEVVVLPSIDQFYSEEDDPQFESFMVNYDFISGRQSRCAIESLFYQYHIINTTVLVVNNLFDIVDCFNIFAQIKCSYKSLEIISFNGWTLEDKNITANFTLNDDYKSVEIADILKEYNHTSYRFYVNMGSYIDKPENMIKLHGFVMNSESSIQLNPDKLSCELFEHFTDESTQDYKDMAKILRPIANAIAEKNELWNHSEYLAKTLTPDAKMLVQWGHNDMDRSIDIEYHDEIVDELKNFQSFETNAKYTIKNSMQKLLKSLQNEMNWDKTEEQVLDDLIYNFTINNTINKKTIAYDISNDNAKFIDGSEYKFLHSFVIEL